MNQGKSDGVTPFHMAASNNDVQILDLFLQKKGEIDIPNDDGWTALHFAGCLNNFDALNLLIEAGGDLTARYGKLSPYEEIVRSDNAELLECVWPTVRKD